MFDDPVLVACFPGCGWNGEVQLDSAGIWRCPQCDTPRRFKPSRPQPRDDRSPTNE